MAGQQLTTTVVINARTGNGFSKVGATLTELGSLVDGISQKLINFGEDSVNVYRDYEKSMTDAEVALSTTYGRGTQELAAVMTQLDAKATEWAASTIFHTDDVANAVSEMAHAGWDLDQILEGMPAAMQLAQAGSLDLSEAVNYIVKSTSAAGIGFEDIGDFIDLWAFAANSSASNIGEFGDAMLRMGSTMRFAADPEELMTLIAITANAGQVGSEAGTLVRNSMMRLVAPTKKANEAMAELGATSMEAAELMDDQALAAANARLEANGFSAFDEKGNLKNVLDIYRELYMALGEVAGGFEDIDRNEDALSILSAIFPTRTITEALTLLRGAAEGYDGLYESMKGGDAAGYGEYASETMMDTLNGKIETFESKVERLKQLVGEELAGQLEGVLEAGGSIVDTIAGMDEGKLGALVSGLEVIAAAGPGLLLAGGAFRFIGAVASMGTAGKIMLAAVAIAAVVRGLERLEEADFESKFGTMELDQTQMASYVNSLGDMFDQNREKINGFNSALEQAAADYQTNTESFASKLLGDSLTGDEVDSDTYYEMGEKIGQSLLDGIDANFSGLMASINGSFGSENPEDINDPIWAQIIDVVSQGYEEEKARAEQLSQDLRDAMTSAFKDGALTGEERQNIQAILDEQNELMARQQDRAFAQEKARILQKAQSVGLDSIKESAELAMGERDKELETLAAEHAGALFDVETFFDDAIANGQLNEATGRAYTNADKNNALAELASRQEAERLSYESGFNNFLLDLFTAGAQQSDLGTAWSALQDMATSIQDNGGILTQDAINNFTAAADNIDAGQLNRYLNMMVSSLGGIERIQENAEYNAQQGNTELASQYQMIADMVRYSGYAADGNLRPEVMAAGTGTASDNGLAQLESILAQSGTGYTMDTLADILSDRDMVDWASVVGDTLTTQMESLSRQYTGVGGNLGISDWVNSLIQENPVTMPVEPEMQTESLENLPPVPIDVIPRAESLSLGLDGAAALQSMGADVSVDGDTQQLNAAIQAEDGAQLMSYVSGDASDLHMSIMSEDGQTIATNVTGDTSQLAAAINAYRGQTIVVNLVGQKLFGSGGRADTASIFGEAGPEWAIPEEHSPRTAALLDAARAASGFTWGELLARNGGLNANPDNVPTTIVYSPTINAADASGVEEVLRQDKNRLDKWYREMQLRDRAEVYA